MSKPEPKKISPGSSKTLLKGLKALEAVCLKKEGLKQSELAVLLGADRSTALRILNTMTAAGYLLRDADGRYHPTMKIPRLSHLILEGMEIRFSARPHLDKVSLDTGFSSHLAILSGEQVIYVDGVEGRGMIKVNAGIGSTAPVHCSATGKALAAHLEESYLKTILQSSPDDNFLKPYTDKTITGFPELLAELALSRRRGYALDNEEYEPGINCIAAPIFDYSGTVVATIGVSGTVSRIEEKGIEALAETLMAAASDISLSLGYVKSEKRGEKNV
ncbi:MAG: IclR family transcriptional regulator [Dethiobacteria bacterium]|nr:IclR family transcriptional regulator [Dethiobacteria bacterium]